MDAEYNQCWSVQKIFNLMGYRAFMLCLGLLRLNGGLPYTWHYIGEDKKVCSWNTEGIGRKATFVLTRKTVLVRWSSFQAFIVCATLISYVIFFVTPKLQEVRSTTSTAMLLKSLVEFVATMGLTYHMRLKEGLLARLLCALYGLITDGKVPRTMERSWMQVASSIIVMSSFLLAFVPVTKSYTSQHSLYSKVDFVFMIILNIVMSASVLPVMLLMHYVTVMMAIRYHEISCQFRKHALDFVPAQTTEAMVVPERRAAQPYDSQRLEQLNPSKEVKMTPPYFPKLSLEGPVMHTLDTNIHLIYNLQRLQRLLNEYFSIPVLLTMMRSIISLIFLFFFMVMNSEEVGSAHGVIQAIQEIAFILLMCLSSDTVSKQV